MRGHTHTNTNTTQENIQTNDKLEAGSIREKPSCFLTYEFSIHAVSSSSLGPTKAIASSISFY